VKGEVLAHVTNPFGNTGRTDHQERLGPVALGHRHEETRNAENVVSMEMRDENGANGRDTKACLENLSLSPFSAVEKEYFSFPPDGQGGGIPPFRGDGAPCSEKNDFHGEFIAAFGSF